MRRLRLPLVLTIGAIVSPSVVSAGSKPKIGEDCRFEGHPLWGKVKIVTRSPDIKVEIVDNFEDLKVQPVENFPDRCGEWKIVSNFPDVKVQFVENFGDFKIRFVENFPGRAR